VNASEGWLANADGRGLTTEYSHKVIPGGRECAGTGGSWAVSTIATGMTAGKQLLQFHEHIKNKRKSWDSDIEFTMPGVPALYREYKPTDVPA
jgi:hypothetical protein